MCDAVSSLSGVYVIENNITLKRYYGSAANLRTRKNAHWKRLQSGTHANIHLQRSWNKHGKDCFVFRVVEYVDLDCLIDVEQKYIDLNVDGYNIAPCARSRLGVKVSSESRQRMSQAHKGKRRSLESRLKQIETTRGRPGKIPSLETRSIWSLQRKGRKQSQQVRAVISEKQRQRWAAIPRGPVTIACDGCGKDFVVSYIQRKRRRTCSESCANLTRSQTKRNSLKWRKLTHDGLTLTVREWSKRTGISRITINDRLWRGWSVNRALTVKNGREHPQRQSA